MRSRLLFIGMAAVLLLTGCATDTEVTQVFRHPSLNIQFKGPKGMQHQSWPGEVGVYEVFDPQSEVHVVVWHTETEQDGLAYLSKMADMKGLALDREPEKRSIGGCEAWVLNTTGVQRDTPIHTLLAVLPHGKVRERPKENFLFIMQVWCPDSSWTQHQDTMEAILGSTEIVQ